MSHVLRGYAAVSGAISNVIGDPPREFRERFLPGAFTESIARGGVRALFSHSDGLQLGSQRSGSLRLSEDKHGLAFELDLPDVHAWIAEGVQAGRFPGMSFRFRAEPRDVSWTEERSYRLRTIKRANLLEVSLVRNPAYPQTSVRVVRESTRRFTSVPHGDPLFHMRARLALAERLC
jgi:uncharacterized protein